jgi:hypothetical protein
MVVAFMIHFCNNPMTKRPKLVIAKTWIAESPSLHAEA